MECEGPLLESLTRRLAETPEDFLAEPRIGSAGRVHAPAVVADLLQRLGTAADAPKLRRFAGEDPRRDRNRLSITLLFCWLLADDWFRPLGLNSDQVMDIIAAEAAELADRVAARKFVTDPDRREELARLALARLGFRPAGEKRAQAQDRLATLNSAERARVLQAARVAEERARKIRQALAKKAAEESADKWTRE